MLIVNSNTKNIEILGTFEVSPNDWLFFKFYASFEGVENLHNAFVQKGNSRKNRYVKMKNLDNSGEK